LRIVAILKLKTELKFGFLAKFYPYGSFWQKFKNGQKQIDFDGIRTFDVKNEIIFLITALLFGNLAPFLYVNAV